MGTKEVYSRSGQQATMEGVQEWLIEGQEMLVSSDDAFVQKMEALNAKKCRLVEAQQAREKKLKFVKDNLVMLENVRREKEMEVMKLYRVFVSLPKNFLEVAATRVKDEVFPAGDSCGGKRKFDGRRDQMWQHSVHSTPINKVPPKTQPRLLHHSDSVKKMLEEMENKQLCPSKYQLSTPNYKLPPKSQDQLSHESRLMKKKIWGEMENEQLYPRREPLSRSSYQLLPRSQPRLSDESHMVKSNFGQPSFASGEQKRQHFIPPNKVQDLEPQSMTSGPVAGGVMQEMRLESKEVSFIHNKCTPLRVTSSSFYLKGILKKK